MKNQIVELLVSLIPLLYGSYLYIRVVKITNKSTEEELVEMDTKLSRMKKSSLMFFLIGAYLIYQFYNNNYA